MTKRDKNKFINLLKIKVQVIHIYMKNKKVDVHNHHMIKKYKKTKLKRNKNQNRNNKNYCEMIQAIFTMKMMSMILKKNKVRKEIKLQNQY